MLNHRRTDILDEWADPQQIVYTMDILGNITTLNRKNSGADAGETRSCNATNELTTRTVAAEAARNWVDDDFADNDTTGYAVADLNTGVADGTWSASSGKLNCTGTCTPSGHSAMPDVSQGSLILIDVPAYKAYTLKPFKLLIAGFREKKLVRHETPSK